MSGPTLLLERDASLPLIHTGISTRSGATEDPPGLEGLTRIAGRLMRRTAGGQSADQIDARIDRMGASLGLDAGHGGVALSGVVLERSFGELMALLEETLTAPGLAQDELERLKRETAAELTEILDSDQQLVQRWFLRSVFAGHPYGRTVIVPAIPGWRLQIYGKLPALSNLNSNTPLGFRSLLNSPLPEITV